MAAVPPTGLSAEDKADIADVGYGVSVIGRNDEETNYNTINTREILVYGEKLG